MIFRVPVCNAACSKILRQEPRSFQPWGLSCTLCNGSTRDDRYSFPPTTCRSGTLLPGGGRVFNRQNTLKISQNTVVILYEKGREKEDTCFRTNYTFLFFIPPTIVNLKNPPSSVRHLPVACRSLKSLILTKCWTRVLTNTFIMLQYYTYGKSSKLLLGGGPFLFSSLCISTTTSLGRNLPSCPAQEIG